MEKREMCLEIIRLIYNSIRSTRGLSAIMGEDARSHNPRIRLKIRKKLPLRYLWFGCHGCSFGSDEFGMDCRKRLGMDRRNLTEFHENSVFLCHHVAIL
jgi:hypothetical protein